MAEETPVCAACKTPLREGDGHLSMYFVNSVTGTEEEMHFCAGRHADEARAYLHEANARLHRPIFEFDRRRAR